MGETLSCLWRYRYADASSNEGPRTPRSPTAHEQSVRILQGPSSDSVSRRNRRSLQQTDRRRAPIPCTNHLIVAPLWVAFEANLGTLLRSCDAVGACMAVPDTDHYHRALKIGNTLASRPCLHWVHTKLGWIDRRQSQGAQIIGVELDEDSISLAQLRQARRQTVILLGHEHSGLPQEVWPYLDQSRRNTDDGSGEFAQRRRRRFARSLQACRPVVKCPRPGRGPTGPFCRDPSTLVERSTFVPSRSEGCRCHHLAADIRCVLAISGAFRHCGRDATSDLSGRSVGAEAQRLLCRQTHKPGPSVTGVHSRLANL